MNYTIFGKSWEQIQAMQQGTYIPDCIDTSKSSKTAATDKDKALLAVHGPDGLRKLRFYGVMDRLGIKDHS